MNQKYHALVEAVKPLIEYIDLFDQRNPRMYDDVIHAFHCELGVAELRFSDLRTIRTLVDEIKGTVSDAHSM